MQIGFQRKMFEKRSVKKLVEFSLLNPHHPNHSERTLNRFLTDLSSSENLVFDYYFHNERALVAVLIDRIQNPSNSANLEVIGFKTNAPYTELIEGLLQEATEALTATRDGIEFSVNEKSVLSEGLLNRHGFFQYYSTFDMMMNSIKMAELRELPVGYNWQVLSNERFREYYEVLTAAFSMNLETSIPSLDEMQASFQTFKRPVTILCDENSHLIGFVSISVEDADVTSGEVHMIGLHPSQRQKGLGSVLLSKALRELALLGVTKVKLTVAATNQKALHLYKKFGFAVVNHDICYRFTAVN